MFNRIDSPEKRCDDDAAMATVAKRLLRPCGALPIRPLRSLTPIAQPMASPKQDRQYSSNNLNSRDRRATTSSHSTPQSRLSLISRHLQDTNTLQLNTPYSTERQSISEQDFDAPPPQQKQEPPKQPSPTMSSQKEHPTVLIPGPIEYSDQVLDAMGTFRYAQSQMSGHLSADLDVASPTLVGPS